jgi:hypothetical protein
MTEEQRVTRETTTNHKLAKFSKVPVHEPYPEPEPILDPTSDFEEMDRGEGMGVDDIKTYHRTEK